MHISDYLSAERGRAALLARSLGVKPVVVARWGSGDKPVPIGRCLAIERATMGQVRRRDLRPLDWQEIWPDLIADEKMATGQVQQAQVAIGLIVSAEAAPTSSEDAAHA